MIWTNRQRFLRVKDKKFKKDYTIWNRTTFRFNRNFHLFHLSNIHSKFSHRVNILVLPNGCFILVGLLMRNYLEEVGRSDCSTCDEYFHELFITTIVTFDFRSPIRVFRSRLVIFLRELKEIRTLQVSWIRFNDWDLGCSILVEWFVLTTSFFVAFIKKQNIFLVFLVKSR